MYLEVNEILLRRKNKVIINKDEKGYESSYKPEYAVSMMKNLENYGYTLSKDLFDKVAKLDLEEINAFYLDLISEIEELTGANRIYKPMYPNFPYQVMEADDAELFVNALVHYWSYGELLPEYKKEKRFPLVWDKELKVISIGTYDDLIEIGTNILQSKTNISDQDKEDLKEILSKFRIVPDEIPNKEVCAFYCTCIMEYYRPEMITRFIKTPTDLLRVITCLSGGDVSLATNTKFTKLKRKYRKFIVDTLNSFDENSLEDLFRYREKWIRIGEIVHPGEYVKKYPDKYQTVEYVFEKLRADDKPLFFNGKVEKAIKEGNVSEAVDILSSRPGELGRRLDQLLSISENEEERKTVLNTFLEKAEKISTSELWQIVQHFKDRNKENKRIFFPKGNVSKLYVIDNNLKDIDYYSTLIVQYAKIGLYKQYRERNKLGKVYIDPELKNYIVPFSQRSANSGSKIITRGSKLPIDDSTNIVRGFIWWTNTGNGYYNRVDLDLSASIYNDKMEYLDHISYTNLRSGKFNGFHSGDITNGGDVDGDGVAEFIDIDLNQVIENGGRYVVYQVYSYTGQRFDVLPNCSFGWMSRSDFNSGEIFEPKTVENKIDVRSRSCNCVPVIFDCKERKAIWCDIQFASYTTYLGGNNLESNKDKTDYTLYAMTHLSKPNLYDLVFMNGIARGYCVSDKEESDIVFSSHPETVVRTEKTFDDDGKEIEVTKEIPVITPFDIDYIVGNLL